MKIKLGKFCSAVGSANYNEDEYRKFCKYLTCLPENKSYPCEECEYQEKIVEIFSDKFDTKESYKLFLFYLIKDK